MKTTQIDKLFGGDIVVDDNKLYVARINPVLITKRCNACQLCSIDDYLSGTQQLKSDLAAFTAYYKKSTRNEVTLVAGHIAMIKAEDARPFCLMKGDILCTPDGYYAAVVENDTGKHEFCITTVENYIRLTLMNSGDTTNFSILPYGAESKTHLIAHITDPL